MLDTEYLRERRRQEGYRLIDMAEKLKYHSANGYWRLERNITRAKLEHVLRLSEIFSEPLENFIVRK